MAWQPEQNGRIALHWHSRPPRARPRRRLVRGATSRIPAWNESSHIHLRLFVEQGAKLKDGGSSLRIDPNADFPLYCAAHLSQLCADVPPLHWEAPLVRLNDQAQSE